MRAELVANLLNRHKRMVEVRDSCEDAMQAAFNYVNPRRYDMTGTAPKGAKRATKMYDGVAQDAFLTWRDGIIGWFVGPAVTSRGPGWHKAALGRIPGIPFERARSLRDNDRVKGYLQDYTDEMRYEIDAAKFYDSEGEWLQDLGSAGTGTIVVEEAMRMDRASLRVPHPGQYWIARNRDGEIDVYHEQVTMTAREALQRYDKPGDTLNATVRQWAKEADASLADCTFLQCICPADEPGIFPRRMTYKPWALVTILYDMTGAGGRAEPQPVLNDAQRLVRVEGMDYFSPAVCRLRTNSDEVYGRSPAMDVMAVIEACQEHGYNLMNLGNHAANPMRFVPAEKRLDWNFRPGATNTYSQEKRIAYGFPMATEYPVAVDREDKLHRLIYSRYGYDLFRMMQMYQEKRERNQAYEIAEAAAQQARLMVSQTGNMWQGGIVPVYNNIAWIASRSGRMPTAPPELQDQVGKDIVIVDPVSPLSQLQEMAAMVSPLQQGMNFLAQIAEVVGRHVSPEMARQIYHRVNLPDLAEFALDKTGFPRRLMRTDGEVATLVEQDEQRAAAAEQARNAREIAAAYAQLGKPVAGNSLLAGVA